MNPLQRKKKVDYFKDSLWRGITRFVYPLPRQGAVGFILYYVGFIHDEPSTRLPQTFISRNIYYSYINKKPSLFLLLLSTFFPSTLSRSSPLPTFSTSKFRFENCFIRINVIDKREIFYVISRTNDCPPSFSPTFLLLPQAEGLRCP